MIRCWTVSFLLGINSVSPAFAQMAPSQNDQNLVTSPHSSAPGASSHSIQIGKTALPIQFPPDGELEVLATQKTEQGHNQITVAHKATGETVQLVLEDSAEFKENLSTFAQYEKALLAKDDISSRATPKSQSLIQIAGEAYKGFPLQAALFGIGGGIVTAGTLLLDWSKNPVLLQEFFEGQKDPLGMAAFANFMAANHIVGTPLRSILESNFAKQSPGTHIQRRALMGFIPYLGMAFGSLASSMTHDLYNLFSDKDLYTCFATRAQNSSVQEKAQVAQACQTAYEKWVISGKVVEALSGIAAVWISQLAYDAGLAAIKSSIKLGAKASKRLGPKVFRLRAVQAAAKKFAPVVARQATHFIPILGWGWDFVTGLRFVAEPLMTTVGKFKGASKSIGPIVGFLSLSFLDPWVRHPIQGYAKSLSLSNLSKELKLALKEISDKNWQDLNYQKCINNGNGNSNGRDGKRCKNKSLNDLFRDFSLTAKHWRDHNLEHEMMSYARWQKYLVKLTARYNYARILYQTLGRELYNISKPKTGSLLEAMSDESLWTLKAPMMGLLDRENDANPAVYLSASTSAKQSQLATLSQTLPHLEEQLQSRGRWSELPIAALANHLSRQLNTNRSMELRSLYDLLQPLASANSEPTSKAIVSFDSVINEAQNGLRSLKSFATAKAFISREFSDSGLYQDFPKEVTSVFLKSFSEAQDLPDLRRKLEIDTPIPANDIRSKRLRSQNFYFYSEVANAIKSPSHFIAKLFRKGGDWEVRKMRNDNFLILHGLIAQLGTLDPSLIGEAILQIRARLAYQQDERLLISLRTMLDFLGPQAEPMIHEGQAFFKVMSQLPGLREKTETVATTGLYGLFQIQTPAELFLMDMICGKTPNSEQNFITINEHAGLPVEFSGPRITPIDIEPFLKVRGGSYNVCSMHRLPEGRHLPIARFFSEDVFVQTADGEKKYKGVGEFLRMNARAEFYMDANGSFNSEVWWEENLTPELLSAFDGFAHRYTEVAASIKQRILQKSPTYWNFGPFGNGIAATMMEETRIYLNTIQLALIGQSPSAETADCLLDKSDILPIEEKIFANCSLLTQARFHPQLRIIDYQLQQLTKLLEMDEYAEDRAENAFAQMRLTLLAIKDFESANPTLLSDSNLGPFVTYLLSTLGAMVVDFGFAINALALAESPEREIRELPEPACRPLFIFTSPSDFLKQCVSDFQED